MPKTDPKTWPGWETWKDSPLRVPRDKRPTCGAKNRKGLPCQCKKLYKGNPPKCRFHGGLSLDKADKERITKETGRVFKKTGPATTEGKRRSVAAWIEQGLKNFAKGREKRRLAVLARLAKE